MNRIKIILKDIALPVCLSFIFTILYHFYRKDNLSIKVEYTSLLNRQIQDRNTNFSSVSCRGNNHTERLCTFKNLCFDPFSKTFVFFRSPKSIQSGLPTDRFSPALTDFSSIPDHNTLYFNYAELPYSAVSKFNISWIEGHGLILKRFNPDNLMHTFHDDLLPIYATLEEINKIHSNNTFLIFADGKSPGPYESLYQNFLAQEPIYTFNLSVDFLHCFKNIYVGLNKSPTWYQYGFKIPQGPLTKLDTAISPIILNFREYFFQRFSIPISRKAIYAALLLRKQNRKILNEDEVARAISSLTGLKVIKISLEDYSVIDAIQILTKCQLVLGMHGSILILSLFLPPTSIVYEFFPYGIKSSISTPYKTLCKVSGLNFLYVSWENYNENLTLPHPDYPTELGGINHLDLIEQEKIKASVVQPFLCCDDKVWLYRIYQDTIVDIESLNASLKEVLKKQQNLLSIGGYNENEESVFSPSEVQNASCTVSKQNKCLVLTWDKPWTLGFVNKLNIDYEVWVQEAGTENVQAFLVKNVKFVYEIAVTNIYYAWVRCHTDGKIGPFSSSIICS